MLSPHKDLASQTRGVPAGAGRPHGMASSRLDAAVDAAGEVWRESLLRQVLATAATAVCWQLVLPDLITASEHANYVAMVVCWLAFDGVQRACRRMRAGLREALRRRARLVDAQLEVSTALTFSLPKYQAAFERWEKHSVLDWMPNVIALAGQLGVLIQMFCRPGACSPGMQLSQLPLTLAYVAKLLFWRQLSFAQRSWSSIATLTCAITQTAVNLAWRDTCYQSLFQSRTTSLKGIMLLQLMVASMGMLAMPVTVRHMPLTAMLSTVGFTLTTLLHSQQHTGVRVLTDLGEDAPRTISALSLCGVVLIQLACTVRHIVAKYNMTMFLVYLQQSQRMASILS